MRPYHVFAVSCCSFVVLVLATPTGALPPLETPPGALHPARRETKWGYVNHKREFVIPPQFDLAAPFSEGLAAVLVGDRAGYINYSGSMVVEPQFEVAGIFSGGLAGVQKAGRFGYIDQSGKYVIQPSFEAVGTFSEGLASVKTDGKYVYINRQGRLVISPQYELAGPFSSGLATIKVGGKYGYIDNTGKSVVGPEFDWAGQFSEGLAGVRVGSKYGYVNDTGRMAIEARFTRLVGPFSEGLCGVYDDAAGKYGWIDMGGRYKIAPQFDAVGPFYKGLASARTGDRVVVVDALGGSTGLPAQLLKVSFTSTPAGAEIRITEEWRWFVATDKEYLYSTLEPRPEGRTDRDIVLSRDSVHGRRTVVGCS